MRFVCWFGVSWATGHVRRQVWWWWWWEQVVRKFMGLAVERSIGNGLLVLNRKPYYRGVE